MKFFISSLLLVLLLVLLSFNNASASYPEFFGASFTTSAIGNQSNLDSSDPSNNYYSPSILAFSRNVNILAQMTSTSTFFKSISGITITNSTNSTTSPTIGNALVNYPNFLGGSLHFALPIGLGTTPLGTLALSLFMPVGNLIETHSGNPFLPEYVMYHSRYKRTSIYLNFAHKLSDDFSFSLGTILGFQASAEVKTNLSLNGADYGSWGQARTKIGPSLGIITSIAKNFNKAKIYFTYQQEMKSNLHAGVIGEVTNPSLVIFESGIDSMIFYDPHTFRLGTSYDLKWLELFLGLEYQLWTGYKPPTILITKAGGVIVPSNNYEKITTQNTLNPRFGLSVPILESLKVNLGLMYRASPLKGDFSGSGNSIDTDVTAYTMGLDYKIVLWTKDVHFGTSFEYHQLKSKLVKKTEGQENGTAGEKIGGPGFIIGGHVIASSFGVKFNF